jgi:hypothetical protein
MSHECLMAFCIWASFWTAFFIWARFSGLLAWLLGGACC